jgi:hypothetical protein
VKQLNADGGFRKMKLPNPLICLVAVLVLGCQTPMIIIQPTTDDGNERIRYEEIVQTGVCRVVPMKLREIDVIWSDDEKAFTAIKSENLERVLLAECVSAFEQELSRGDAIRGHLDELRIELVAIRAAAYRDIGFILPSIRLTLALDATFRGGSPCGVMAPFSSRREGKAKGPYAWDIPVSSRRRNEAFSTSVHDAVNAALDQLRTDLYSYCPGLKEAP